jgi:hypothetical protein
VHPAGENQEDEMMNWNVILREVEGGVEVSGIDPVASMQANENAELTAVSGRPWSRDMGRACPRALDWGAADLGGNAAEARKRRA